MAEVDRSGGRVITRPPEPPGRLRNRLARYRRRKDAARNTKELLAAAADYFRATFAGYSPGEIEGICDRLIEHTDRERRQADGSK